MEDQFLAYLTTLTSKSARDRRLTMYRKQSTDYHVAVDLGTPSLRRCSRLQTHVVVAITSNLEVRTETSKQQQSDTRPRERQHSTVTTLIAHHSSRTWQLSGVAVEMPTKLSINPHTCSCCLRVFESII